MYQTSIIKQRYYSLLIAISLHSILLVLIILYIPKYAFDGFEFEPHRQGSAISFGNLKSSSLSQSTIAQGNDSDESIESPTLAQDNKNSEDQSTAISTVGSETGLTEQFQNRSEQTNTLDSEKTENPRPKIRRRRRRASHSQSGLAKKFIESFKRVVREEKQREIRINSDTFHEQPSNNFIAEERLRQWARACYLQRTSQAILKSSKITLTHCTITEDLEGECVIRFINLDGSGLKPVIPDDGFIHPDLDQHINKFIANIDLPPIPSRLKDEPIEFRVIIRYKCKKGQAGVMQLLPE